MLRGTPLARPGQRIGLLGGSFDPPHQGHVHITREALKRFDLDQIWWLVSPGNPLKTRGPAPMAKRMAACRVLMQHPKVRISNVEAQLGTHVTADTLARLAERLPGVRFVWLMGADNLAQFHHWHHWRRILRQVPIGVLARPGDRISARTSLAARVFAAHRIPGAQSHVLALRAEPCAGASRAAGLVFSECADGRSKLERDPCAGTMA